MLGDGFIGQNERSGSLFGAHPQSVAVAEGVDLVTARITDELEAETGQELGH